MARHPDQVLRLIALAFVVIAAIAAANGLREPAAHKTEAPLEDAAGEVSAELRRCRDLTVEEVEADAVCKAAWAASRRRFLSAPAGDHRLQD